MTRGALTDNERSDPELPRHSPLDQSYPQPTGTCAKNRSRIEAMEIMITEIKEALPQWPTSLPPRPPAEASLSAMRAGSKASFKLRKLQVDVPRECSKCLPREYYRTPKERASSAIRPTPGVLHGSSDERKRAFSVISRTLGFNYSSRNLTGQPAPSRLPLRFLLHPLPRRFVDAHFKSGAVFKGPRKHPSMVRPSAAST